FAPRTPPPPPCKGVERAERRPEVAARSGGGSDTSNQIWDHTLISPFGQELGMANNPLNLGLRFLLELVALFAVGYWGWTQHQGVMRFVLAIGLPALLAAAWGIFRVPGDASASGEAIVAVP